MEVKYDPKHHHQVAELCIARYGTDPFTMFEIGTKAGDLTWTLLERLPNLEKIYTCDPWRHFEDGRFEAAEPQEYHNLQRQCAETRLERHAARIKIMNMTSDEAYSDLIEKGIKVDAVHIDGDHSGPQVNKDIYNARKVLKENGLLCGHDYGLVGEVTAVVDAHYGGQVKTGGDFVWWIE